ncbi:MAG: Uma2 family endonuclease [Cyanobacteriota bacterium]|nr:Uma2 family endonuclease [Cyanobacteriota bacterium]
MEITLAPERLSLDPGSAVFLEQQTWADYQALLTLRGESSWPKIYFHDPTHSLFLMAPLPSHGNRIDTLRDLVKILLRAQGQDWQCFDPITLRRWQTAGVEPDTCFYLENRQAILGKERLDLALDPPPDLAIEVDLTSPTALAAYESLGVPELWIYRLGELKIFCLLNGAYQEQSQSPRFPQCDLQTLLPHYIELAWREGSSAALRQFEMLIQTKP